MFIDTFEAEGLAQLSYLVGDEVAGLAVVIDPRRDIGDYLERARERGVRIVAAIDTHIHADFVSGAAALRRAVGAKLHGGPVGYRFPVDALTDGDEIRLGKITLSALHTPGHTPEHICLVARGGRGAEAPWGVFTGDTLFAGEVGRPDLLGEGTEDGLARQLFHTLHEKLLPLGDELIVYPGHGKGSPCGGAIGDRTTTTIGYERRHNPRLAMRDEDAFVKDVLSSQTPAPRYYARMKRVNANDPADAPSTPIPPLDAKDVAARQQAGALVLDTRDIEAFGGAHVPDALNIPLSGSFAVWAGKLLDEKRDVVLVGDTSDIERARVNLARIGMDRVVGWLRGGMKYWEEAGLPLARVQQMSVHQVKERSGDLQVLDVRYDDEFAAGHVPGAVHVELSKLEQAIANGAGALDPSRPVATYCGSGSRAGIAASILRRAGFGDVRAIPGSMTAWKNAGYPTEQ
ncbi:MAG TPA: rhodanese-like domain-containing protein [Longimicrobiales bacterium]